MLRGYRTFEAEINLLARQKSDVKTELLKGSIGKLECWSNGHTDGVLFVAGQAGTARSLDALLEELDGCVDPLGGMKGICASQVHANPLVAN